MWFCGNDCISAMSFVDDVWFCIACAGVIDVNWGVGDGSLKIVAIRYLHCIPIYSELPDLGLI